MKFDFDYRKLQKYASPQAFNDLNDFLESLPVRAGQGVLIAAGIAWAVAGFAIFYAIIQAQQVAELRTELLKAEALVPQVPKIVRESVPDQKIKAFAARVDKAYQNVKVVSSGNTIKVTSGNGRFFGAYREAIGHLFNGGDSRLGETWRIDVKSMCVGRECKGNFLNGEFTVYKLAVDKG